MDNLKNNLLKIKQDLLRKCSVSVDIDTEGDETDEIQGNLILSLANKLNLRDLDKLKQINIQLQKIEDSTYGICEDCNESIPDARLLANPYCLTCISCAEDRELTSRKRL
jgi:DnaK suppressor protein